MIDESVLKPCPFCGSEARVSETKPVFYSLGVSLAAIVVGCSRGCAKFSRSLTEWDAEKHNNVNVRERVEPELIECWNTRHG